MKVKNVELDIDYGSVDDVLHGLSHADIDDIVRSYYDRDGYVRDILYKYHLDIIPNDLGKHLPDIKTGNTCRYDGSPMVESLKRKSNVFYDDLDLASRTYLPRLIFANQDDHCSDCGHTEGPYCNCRHCQARRKDADKLKREAVVTTHQLMRRQDKVDFSALSLRDRLQLGALLRGFLSEDMTYIHGINTQPEKDPLLPDKQEQFDLMSFFLDNRVLIIARNSDLAAFNFDKDYNIPSFYPLSVNYNLNLTHPFDTDQGLIEHLCYPNKDDFLRDADTYFQIEQDIWVDECQMFLMDELKKVNFDDAFRPGAKTTTVLKHLGNDFSEGQIFYMIHNRVTKATRYYQEYPVSKRQAANSVITNLERYGEQILAHDWDVAPYHWPYHLKRSQVSHFFFDYISV